MQEIELPLEGREALELRSVRAISVLTNLNLPAGNREVTLEISSYRRPDENRDLAGGHICL